MRRPKEHVASVVHDAGITGFGFDVKNGRLRIVFSRAHAEIDGPRVSVEAIVEGVGEFTAFEVERPDYVSDGSLTLDGDDVPVVVDSSASAVTWHDIDEGSFTLVPASWLVFRAAPGRRARIGLRVAHAAPGLADDAAVSDSPAPATWTGGRLTGFHADVESGRIVLQIEQAALTDARGRPTLATTDVTLSSTELRGLTAFRLRHPCNLGYASGLHSVPDTADRSLPGGPLTRSELLLRDGVFRWRARQVSVKLSTDPR